eukprot:scaffold4955_cov204-Amphora_coffeaeformis.AAC.7
MRCAHCLIVDWWRKVSTTRVTSLISFSPCRWVFPKVVSPCVTRSLAMFDSRTRFKCAQTGLAKRNTEYGIDVRWSRKEPTFVARCLLVCFGAVTVPRSWDLKLVLINPYEFTICGDCHEERGMRCCCCCCGGGGAFAMVRSVSIRLVGVGRCRKL